MVKHYLAGKARSLEDALSVMRKVLKRYGFSLSEHRWLNPAPYIWSVHVKAENCPLLFANGKGVSREAALASAYGEFLERLMTGYFFGDYALPCEQLSYAFVPDEQLLPVEQAWHQLPDILKRLWDPETWVIPHTALPDLACCETQVRCLPLSPWVQSEDEILVPWNVLMNFYGSNGLSAGNTPLEAQIQGLSEIFERWVRREIILNNVCLPEVPETVLAASERVMQAREALAAQGVTLSVRDASLGQGYPVVAIILYQQGQGRAFVSFGAHPIFEVALERTLTEAFQGRALAQFEGFRPPSDDLEWVQSAENLETHFIDASGQFHWHFFSDAYDFDYAGWGMPVAASFETQWQYLTALLAYRSQPLYGRIYAADGFYACRMIAPGMSEVFPLDELSCNNQNSGCRLRKHLLDFEQTSQWAEQLLEMLDELGWAEHLSVASTIGLAASPESHWRGVKMIDLRMGAYCMLKDWAAVEDWLESAMLLSQDIPIRQGAYQVLACWIQQGSLRHYSAALRHLYDPQSLAWAERWYAGEGFAPLPMGERLLQDPWQQALWQTHPGMPKGVC